MEAKAYSLLPYSQVGFQLEQKDMMALSDLHDGQGVIGSHKHVVTHNPSAEKTHHSSPTSTSSDQSRHF